VEHKVHGITTQVCSYSMKTVMGSMWANGHGCVLVEFYLQEQAASPGSYWHGVHNPATQMRHTDQQCKDHWETVGNSETASISDLLSLFTFQQDLKVFLHTYSLRITALDQADTQGAEAWEDSWVYTRGRTKGFPSPEPQGDTLFGAKQFMPPCDGSPYHQSWKLLTLWRWCSIRWKSVVM
jgi:hypothetical protein